MTTLGRSADGLPVDQRTAASAKKQLFRERNESDSNWVDSSRDDNGCYSGNIPQMSFRKQSFG